MFYCHIDHSLPRTKETITTLFEKYAAGNPYQTMEEAYAHPIEIGAFKDYPPKLDCPLKEDEGTTLGCAQWAGPNTLSTCSLILAYDDNSICSTYVYHAGGGCLEGDHPELEERAGSCQILIATPEFTIPGQDITETSYYDAAQKLLRMGYTPDRISLLDGVEKNFLIFMCGDGTLGAG